MIYIINSKISFYTTFRQITLWSTFVLGYVLLWTMTRVKVVYVSFSTVDIWPRDVWVTMIIKKPDY